MTSIAKIAAVSGVPNSAENRPLMPHITAIGRSLSFSLISLPKKLPMQPPSCKAAPSRPAEPPKRWVITVDMKITGASSIGTLSSLRTERIMRLVSA